MKRIPLKKNGLPYKPKQSAADVRLKIVEYLGDPNNPWLSREALSRDVLGYAMGSKSLRQLLTTEGIDAAEREALELRRTRYAPALSAVDKALLARAGSADGTAADAKLAYQRFENWSEKVEHKFSGPAAILLSLDDEPEPAKKPDDEDGGP